MAIRSRYEGYANAMICLQKSKEEKQKATQQKNFSTRESVLAKLKELKGNPGIVRVPIEAGDNNA